MPMVVPTVLVWFGTSYTTPNAFTLNSATRGLLNNATYVLAGDAGTDVATDLTSISISRGRSTELDEYQAGTATVVLQNFDRVYDSLNAAGIYYGDLEGGKRVTIGLQGQTVFDGIIEDWHVDWPNDGTPTASFVAVDALAQLNRCEFTGFYTTEGQKAGARIADLLSRGEVNFPLTRDLDTGVSTLVGTAVEYGTNVLEEIRTVARSDDGRVFADRRGTLCFRDRHSLFNAATDATFRDDLTGIDFYGVTTANGSALVFNRWNIDRVGGTIQTAQDDTSALARGWRSKTLTGLQMDTDGQAKSMAEFKTSVYGNPVPRIDSITINVSALSTAQAAVVAALDLNNDVVRILWTPRGVGAQVDQTLMVNRVEHQWSSGQVHTMRLELAPFQSAMPFRLNDATYGVLNQSRLAF